MNQETALPFNASLERYSQQAVTLLEAVRSGDEDAKWRFKWEHPRFRGKPVSEVEPAALELQDAQVVVAQEYAFDTWAALAAFTESVQHDESVARFETAVEAVVSGDLAALRAMLRAHPELAWARSARRHHATLLHYVAANGVEGGRQRTPANAVEIAKLLLETGAEADAPADMYDAKCTTLGMLLSSCHPHRAGLQAALAMTLIDHGASLEARGSKWQSTLMTALMFGYLDTAEALVSRGARVDNIGESAGLGRLHLTARLLPGADGESRQVALALAAQHGHADVVALLLDAGEDPDRYNPDGFHSHSTPLHQAVWSGHLDVVRLLVERGARLDIKDTIYQATPLGWADYSGRAEIAEYLRSRGAVS